MRATKRSMQGVSMIEVLVTTVVLALGILGTSALQITGLKGSDSAHYRTVATLIANEMAERIRTNQEGVISGDYETNLETPIGCDPIAENTLNCNNDSCTPPQLAIFDQTQLTCGHVKKSGTSWRNAKKGGVVNSLPNGSLTINCGAESCGGNVDHIIVVSWSERDDYAGQNAESSSIILTITP